MEEQKSSLEFFANSRYTVLKVLEANQVKIKKIKYVSLSQQEIADIAHFSKVKTNKIINELIGTGYLVLYENVRGKYVLTDKANNVLRIMSKLL